MEEKLEKKEEDYCWDDNARKCSYSSFKHWKRQAGDLFFYKVDPFKVWLLFCRCPRSLIQLHPVSDFAAGGNLLNSFDGVAAVSRHHRRHPPPAAARRRRVSCFCWCCWCWRPQRKKKERSLFCTFILLGFRSVGAWSIHLDSYSCNKITTTPKLKWLFLKY